MLFQIVQIFYWLALATWFGGAFFIAMGARIIMRTVEENKPVLPHVLAVNLEGQHGTLLGGTIIGNLLNAFTRVEMVCAAVLGLTVLAQWLMIDVHNQSALISAILRTALLLAACGIVFYDWRMLWPRIWKSRQTFLDHADEPETANPAKDEFDRYQRESVMLLEILIFVLLGIVLFSGAISGPSAAVRQYTFPPPNSIGSDAPSTVEKNP
jgi:hypothetical protein